MQTTSNILMIEPIAFGFNEQTATNNYFQKNENSPATTVQQQALKEFTAMVEKLRTHKINVIVEKDTPKPHTPDSIFPNNWVSFHSSSKVVLYPMFAPNRRMERRMDIIENLEKQGFQVKQIVDLSNYETENKFLEGTGSMILDRENHIAYAALSQRTDKNIFELFCRELDYEPVTFSSFQTVENQRLPIYHTNVLMCVADSYVVICLDTVDDRRERENLVEIFKKTNKTIIEISENEMHNFAGNMLQVQNNDSEKFLVMSQSAYNSLTESQIDTIQRFNKIISVEISTIEKLGGGSARCMMAEIFLPN